MDACGAWEYAVVYVVHHSLLAGVKPPDSALNVPSNQHFTPLPPQEKQQVIPGVVVENMT